MPNIQKDLNPIFETFGLLVVTKDFKTYKNDLISSLNELGFDGEEMYNKELKIFDIYASTFMKNCYLNDNSDFFFNGNDGDFVFLLTYLLSSNYLETIDKYSEEEIKEEIMTVSKELFGKKEKTKNNDEIVFIDKLSLSSSERWKLLMLIQKPKEYLLELTSIIKENRQAFDKAFDSIKGLYAKGILNFINYIETNGKIKEVTKKVINITPCLAIPLSSFVYDDNCFCGLFTSLVLAKNEDEVLKFLKAISDKSRLEIIENLKQEPMFNLEIAEKMNLTTATTSHHASILLSCGLIEAVKKNGKVYYTVNKTKVKKLINDLERKLLK